MASSSGGIVRSSTDPGVYFIGGQNWTVGERYELVKLLGEGSFSQVALAVDKETGEKVALKRIPDVLNSLENAKRVLREVCILRRMDHPGIISLKDLFIRPASTGRCVFRRGQLVSTSLDLYLALEYCDQGDLFHIKGQISEVDVKSIMMQLLQALQYLHDNRVWHRDVKTANILMTYCEGLKIAKIADLGSARSAADRSEGGVSPPRARPSAVAAARAAAAAGSGPDAAAAALAAVAIDGGAPMRHIDSFLGDGACASRSELYARPARGGGAGFEAPLTRLVCTPCYRAPEVVMSRGAYSQAIDVWGAGCVLGELLQRVPWVGKASTPHLQVAPVFAMHGMPKTPASGDRFESGGDPSGASVTRQELKALFQVIGTPSWRSIEDVPSEAWRKYLRRIPGRAPTLFRRFGAAGEVAVDLLQRLLMFDPARRPSCAEAMAHEYFADLREDDGTEEGTEEEDEQAEGVTRPVTAGDATGDAMAVDEAMGRPRESGAAAAAAAAAAEAAEADAPASARGMAIDNDNPMQAPGSVVGEGPFAAVTAAAAAAAAAGGGSGGGTAGEGRGSGSGQESPLAKRARQHSNGGGAAPGRDLCPQTSFFTGMHGDHYYQLDDPAAALALLEEEMSAILSMAQDPQQHPGACGPSDAAADAFRELLEREVADHSQHLEARRRRAAAGGAGTSGATAAAAVASRLGMGRPPGAVWSPKKAAGATAGGGGGAPGRPPHYAPRRGSAHGAGGGGGGSAGGGGIGRVDGWERARPDPGIAVDPSELAMRRVPFHADAEQAHLEAEKHLKAGRHGEWAQTSLDAGPKTVSWGVTLVPPGYDEDEHKDIADVVRAQNKR